MKRTIYLISTLLLFSTVARADVTLPDVISSGMVLQREQRVPIWGKAEAGESVTVSFVNQSKRVVADTDGKWLVRLNPLRANSTPATMTIAGKNKIEL